jgi:CheY-like chemotaxis protein
MLNRLGYASRDVEIAMNGAQALEAMNKSSQQHKLNQLCFDVILMDVVMVKKQNEKQ